MISPTRYQKNIYNITEKRILYERLFIPVDNLFVRTHTDKTCAQYYLVIYQHTTIL